MSVVMFEKVSLSLGPRPFTTVIIGTAMSAPIRPYSVAVAPDSSRTKDLRTVIGGISLEGLHSWWVPYPALSYIRQRIEQIMFHHPGISTYLSVKSCR